MMERVPIMSPELEIIMVQSPATFQELLPDYQYQFQNVSLPDEATGMYQSLVEFMETNSELALSGIDDKDEYRKGFKRAIAMVRLWIDSLYLTEGASK